MVNCAVLKNEDIKGNKYHIKRSINREGETTQGKNENAVRDGSLSGFALSILEQQKQMLVERGIISHSVFPDEDGSTLDPNKLYKQWYYYRKEHGLSVSLHELRHTFISLAKADVPLNC